MVRCPRCDRSYDDAARFCALDGARLDPMIGQTLGEHELVDLLGSGAMGAVYKARHLRLDRWHAIKCLHGVHARRPDVRARFEQDARILARLDDPHFVKIHDCAEAAGGTLYIVMDLVEGVTFDALTAHGRLPPRRAAALVRQTAAALELAHRGGVVHRDIKPGNLMLERRTDSGDFVRILDFGIAKVLGDEEGLTATGSFNGTPGYAAPEQFEGEAVTPETDIYALGVVLFVLLTGVHPFAAPTTLAIIRRQLDETPPSPSMLFDDVPPALGALVSRMLNADPARRPSADEVCALLDAAWTSTPSPAPPAHRRRWPLALGAGALVGIVAAAVVLLPWPRSPGPPPVVAQPTSPPALALAVPGGRAVRALRLNGGALLLQPLTSTAAGLEGQGGGLSLPAGTRLTRCDGGFFADEHALARCFARPFEGRSPPPLSLVQLDTIAPGGATETLSVEVARGDWLSSVPR